MSRHFLDLEGAATVATEQLLDAREMIAATTDALAMAAIYGAAGTGKSFAVSETLRDMPTAQWAQIDFRCRPTLRDIRQAVARSLGHYWPLAGGNFEIDEQLKQILAERPRLVVIDEAQWLNRECFEYLRHLHDDPRTQFSLLFVGGSGCYEVLRREPMLNSRLYAHLRFTPMAIDEVRATIPLYHALHQDVDAELINLIDGACCHGNFRMWAKFTHHAVRFCARAARDRVDEEVVRNVFRLLGGGSTHAA
jgi:type II secretory pathway predicted ATPase ExeA